MKVEERLTDNRLWLSYASEADSELSEELGESFDGFESEVVNLFCENEVLGHLVSTVFSYANLNVLRRLDL